MMTIKQLMQVNRFKCGDGMSAPPCSHIVSNHVMTYFPCEKYVIYYLYRCIPLYITTCTVHVILHIHFFVMNTFMCLLDCVAGSVYFYTQMGSSWSRQGKILAADGATSDYFGSSVSLYTSSALIGASLDDDKGSESGEYVNCGRFDECTTV
jgi:hypothetical protein